jgi:hypothetical protein
MTEPVDFTQHLTEYIPRDMITPSSPCCDDCGLIYGSSGWIEAIVPADIWAIISPTKNEGGLLCITCIAARCVAAGLKNVPVKLSGTEPLVAVDAFPIAVRCQRCQSLAHIATPDLNGLTALGWRYVELEGWICDQH